MRDRATASLPHAPTVLDRVTVDAYNAELRDDAGFLGDRANKRAFLAMIEDSRERLRGVADDPLGDTATDDLSKKKLDKTLIEGDPEAAGVVHGAIEDFSAELTRVANGLLQLKQWRRVERIVVGGGLRASRVGELVIGRASVLLKNAGYAIDVVPIHHHPDEAGLLGAVHLAPPSMLIDHAGVLAIDIGGSNIRVGIVGFQCKKSTGVSKCEVAEMELWRHVDERTQPSREDIVARIVDYLQSLVRWAEKHDVGLAPFIGVGCPGAIAFDGHIERGSENLPGNWDGSRFNLPARLRDALPRIGDHDTTVVMHNDAVVQGLSELAHLDDVEEWAVLTIGAGLGNAKFTKRRRADAPGRRRK